MEGKKKKKKTLNKEGYNTVSEKIPTNRPPLPFIPLHKKEDY